MSYLKRYWWVLILVLLLPKAVDVLFCLSSPTPISYLTALYHLDASDVMSYVTNIVMVLITVFAAFLAFKQYVLLNRTYIVPINKKLFFYADESFAPAFIHDKSDITVDEISSFEVDKDKPIITKMKNIGKGTASDFEVIIEWDEGKAFYDLMSKLGYENYDGFRSTFEPDHYKDICVFNAEESKDWVLPDGLKSMIRHICGAQYANNRKGSPNAMNNNCLIRQKFQIANVEITSNDIMDIFNKRTSFYYSLMIEVDNSISPFTDNYLYSEVKITFEKREGRQGHESNRG